MRRRLEFHWGDIMRRRLEFGAFNGRIRRSLAMGTVAVAAVAGLAGLVPGTGVIEPDWLDSAPENVAPNWLDGAEPTWLDKADPNWLDGADPNWLDSSSEKVKPNWLDSSPESAA